jgi:hypothetical protein
LSCFSLHSILSAGPLILPFQYLLSKQDFVIHTATMHSNIFTLAFCVLAIPTSVIARPNAHAISARNIEPLGRVAHPIALRRRNQRAQLQQASQEAAQAGQEAAAGGMEKEVAAGDKQKEAAAGNKEKEAAAGEKQKEAAAGNKEKEAAAGGEAAAGEEENKESMFIALPSTKKSLTAS